MITFNRPPSEFKAVFGDVRMHDAFYKFLQNIYRLYPEDRFHALIKESCTQFGDDEAIYRHVQRQLPRIKPFHADVTYALPSLFKQKEEMARQTLKLLGGTKRIEGYMEIGSTGRYVSELRKHLDIREPIVLVNDLAPTFSPVDIAERGGLRKIGRFVPLDDYAPLPKDLPAGGFQLVTAYIGLHHCPLEKFDAFMQSIVRLLPAGGVFIVRDHDVTSDDMNTFVSLAHTVFNAGLGVPWATNQAELRFFRPVDDWVATLARCGLRHTGERLLQAHDPSDNVLMAFRKEGA
ncbi:class I SAM-dependent methyltransferase [Ramlibacter albus]|uniref:class I SAM-dependent methyltransferase n=1 Tax=Ramlibacter albus TaxID=2079448 RepID=UPI002102A090|nr:class I SAM-dependent methyltransferase [Ramlibacter albus]